MPSRSSRTSLADHSQWKASQRALQQESMVLAAETAGDPENSLHLDHTTLRHSLEAKYFGPPSPRQEELGDPNALPAKANRVRHGKHKGVRRSLGKQEGRHMAAPRPSTADSIGLDTSQLDYSIIRSAVATPWAHTSLSGFGGTERGFDELKAEVVMRGGHRNKVNAARAMAWEQATPVLAEFIRKREPLTREEMDHILEDDPLADVGSMTSKRAAKLTARLFKRYAGLLPELLKHLEQRYGEHPLPERLPRWKEQASLDKLIAKSQVYLRTDQRSVFRERRRDRGRVESMGECDRTLDHQDRQHPGMVARSEIGQDLGFAKCTPEPSNASRVVQEMIGKKLRPDIVAQGRRVDKTLEMVKGSYFPPSQRWHMRANQATEPPHMRRVKQGDMVVFNGQGTAYRTRQFNETQHITQLQRQCVLGMDEINDIRQIVASLTDEPNPPITFARFLSIMKAIGVGGGAAEVEFFGRLYKVFDADGNGSVEFDELVDGLSTLAGGSARDKLHMYYTMFAISSSLQEVGSDDEEAEATQAEGGGLRRYQVQRMMLTLVQHLGGGGPDAEFSNDDLKRIFSKADMDGDGDIDFEELYDYVAKHPKLLTFITQSSIVFNSGPEEEQEETEDAFKEALLGDETAEPGEAGVEAEAEAAPEGAEAGEGGEGEGGLTAEEVFVDGSAWSDTGFGAGYSHRQHTASSTRRQSSGMRATALLGTPESRAETSLWDQRKASRSEPSLAKLQTGVRASYRAQGVTGFLGMGAKGFVSRPGFDETAERTEAEQRAERSRPQGSVRPPKLCSRWSMSS